MLGTHLGQGHIPIVVDCSGQVTQSELSIELEARHKRVVAARASRARTTARASLRSRKLSLDGERSERLEPNKEQATGRHERPCTRGDYHS